MHFVNKWQDFRFDGTSIQKNNTEKSLAGMHSVVSIGKYYACTFIKSTISDSSYENKSLKKRPYSSKTIR
jgi:hypothetical protein